MINKNKLHALVVVLLVAATFANKEDSSSWECETYICKKLSVLLLGLSQSSVFFLTIKLTELILRAKNADFATTVFACLVALLSPTLVLHSAAVIGGCMLCLAVPMRLFAMIVDSSKKLRMSNFQISPKIKQLTLATTLLVLGTTCTVEQPWECENIFCVKTSLLLMGVGRSLVYVITIKLTEFIFHRRNDDFATSLFAGVIALFAPAVAVHNATIIGSWTVLVASVVKFLGLVLGRFPSLQSHEDRVSVDEDEMKPPAVNFAETEAEKPPVINLTETEAVTSDK